MENRAVARRWGGTGKFPRESPLPQPPTQAPATGRYSQNPEHSASSTSPFGPLKIGFSALA